MIAERRVSVRLMAIGVGILGFALAAPGVAQTAADAAAAWAELRDRLRAAERVDPPSSPRSARVLVLTAFLTRFDRDELRRDPAVLDARLTLASLRLTGFQPQQASDEFDRLLRDVPATDIDRRARASYGRAQADELMQRFAAARDRYRDLNEQFTGTRYADWAEAALRRLDPTTDRRPQAGARAPDFGPRLDTRGQPVSLGQFSDGPALLVFWSPDDPLGMRRVDDVLRRATAAGLSLDRVLGFALDTNRERVAAVVRERGWQFVQIACPTPFVDQTVLAYSVVGTPAWVLLAGEGRYLARDIPPERLAVILRELLR